MPADPNSPVPPPPGFHRRAWRLAGPYWRSEHRWKVRGATGLLLLLTVGQVGISVWGTYWNKALFNALEERSVAGVLVQVGVFALILAVSIAVTAAHLVVKRWLQLDWRAWVTGRLVGRWMADGRHYRLQYVPGEHDNPDGRIAEDIRIATESAIGMAHTFVYSLLSLFVFVRILWTASGSLAVPGTEIQVPGYLVPLAFLYAGIGSALGFGLGRPLVRSTNALQTAEASFRFGLARGREHTETIALMKGEPMERRGSGLRFADVVREWNRQSFAYMGILAFTTGYGGLLPVFPILVAAPQFILGTMSLGVLMQAAQAFQNLTSALSWPVDNLGELARCKASADRVLTLEEGMARLDAEAAAPNEHHIHVEPCRGAHLHVHDLAIAEPTGRILLEHLHLDVRRGERVLVTGDPAVTSALFKVLGELWPWGRGHVRLPRAGGVMFMPQRPFLPEGTLRAALCYPQPADTWADAAVHRAMECAGTAWLGPRVDESANWEQTLPLRAQQRLGFARALLQRPAWLVLEEATDAFDPHGERRMFEMLRHQLPTTAVLTISFHPGLEAVHDRKVVLNRVKEERFLQGTAARA